jgi:hypothetical protein
MSVVALEAIMAVLAVVTFFVAARRSPARTVKLAFPQDLEPGRRTPARGHALV